MASPSSHDILNRIQSLFNQGTPPTRLIAELLPRSRAEALNWARRLPGWDEERGPYPDEVVALARIISRQAMRTFGLVLSEDGRVIEQSGEHVQHLPPAPSLRFQLALHREEVKVAYTEGYFRNSGTDLFYFTSPHDPPHPHALSDSGYWSHFASHDAVEACGGPRRYAALLAVARLDGKERAFTEAFDGAPLESQKQRGEGREATRLPRQKCPWQPSPNLSPYSAHTPPKWSRSESPNPLQSRRPASPCSLSSASTHHTTSCHLPAIMTPSRLAS